MSTNKQLQDQIAALSAQIAALQSGNAKGNGNARPFTAKVSEKGCLTVHADGLRRFGVSLYAGEWQALFNHADEIKAALKAHNKELRHK